MGKEGNQSSDVPATGWGAARRRQHKTVSFARPARKVLGNCASAENPSREGGLRVDFVKQSDDSDDP
jgi:hypothetical protein